MIKTKLDENKFHFYFEEFPYKDSNAVLKIKDCLFELPKPLEKYGQECLIKSKISDNILIFKGGFREFIFEGSEEDIESVIDLVEFVSLNQLQEKLFLMIGHTKIVLDSIDDVLNYLKEKFEFDLNKIFYKESKYNIQDYGTLNDYRDFELFYLDEYSEEFYGFTKIIKIGTLKNYLSLQDKIQKLDLYIAKHKINCQKRKYDSCLDLISQFYDNPKKLKELNLEDSKCSCGLNTEKQYLNQIKKYYSKI